MKKKGIWFLAFIIALWVCTLWYSILRTDSKDLMWIYNWFLDVVVSIDDETRDNSVRCGSLQLLRNDLLNSIEIDASAQVFNWLNKQSFKADQISQNIYYNKFGLFTLDLKSEIEKWVKNTLGENVSPRFLSDWAIVPQSADYYEWKKEKKYWIYSKFKKSINLKNWFESLEDGWFADVYDDIKYFGISCNSDKKYDKVKILYYNSENDFAISLKTWWWDDIILSRWTKWKTFMVTYNLIMSKERNYPGKHNFTKYDCLKIPELNINFERDIYKLKDQKFTDSEGQVYRIDTAIQDVKLDLSNPSWSKKSKNLVDSLDLSSMVSDKYNYFYFDEPFTIFVKEYNKDLPYFAAQISDVKLFQ